MYGDEGVAPLALPTSHPSRLPSPPSFLHSTPTPLPHPPPLSTSGAGRLAPATGGGGGAQALRLGTAPAPQYGPSPFPALDRFMASACSLLVRPTTYAPLGLCVCVCLLCPFLWPCDGAASPAGPPEVRALGPAVCSCCVFLSKCLVAVSKGGVYSCRSVLSRCLSWTGLHSRATLQSELAQSLCALLRALGCLPLAQGVCVRARSLRRTLPLMAVPLLSTAPHCWFLLEPPVTFGSCYSSQRTCSPAQTLVRKACVAAPCPCQLMWCGARTQGGAAASRAHMRNWVMGGASTIMFAIGGTRWWV